MAKKYLSLERLTEYDGKIKGVISAGDDAVKLYVDGLVAEKADKNHNHDDKYYTETEIDSKLESVNSSITNITNGSTPVKEAEHATNADNATNAENAANAEHATTADSATSADSATKATQDGNGAVIVDTYETKEDAQVKYDEFISHEHSWDDLTNKPFEMNESRVLEETYETTLVDNFRGGTSIKTGSDGIPHIAFYNGCDFVITVNGVEYECTYTWSNGHMRINVGDVYELYAHVTDDSVSFSPMVDGETYEFKMEIYNVENTLPEDVIPSTFAKKEHTHSWNDLEDRPFYNDGVAYELLQCRDGDIEDITINMSYFSNWDVYIGNFADYVVESTFNQFNGIRVIFDGETYDCVVKNDYQIMSDAYSYIGNRSIVDSSAEDTGEPFFIYDYFERFGYYTNYEICTNLTDSTHTVTMYGVVENLVKLDEKFIPDTIARTIDVDLALENKADLYHDHDDVYETKEDASAKLDEAKEYADTAANTVKNDLLNGAGDAYDTLKELGDLINTNVDAIEALETVATGKADKATTLSGYGITDAYTKVEIDERTVVDDALSSTSVNPVQNKVVNDAIATLTSTVSTNISSISTNTTAISNLQLAVDNIQDITSEEIEALFA